MGADRVGEPLVLGMVGGAEGGREQAVTEAPGEDEQPARPHELAGERVGQAGVLALDLEGPVTDGFRTVATFVPKLIGFLIILLAGVGVVTAATVIVILNREGEADGVAGPATFAALGLQTAVPVRTDDKKLSSIRASRSVP